MRTIDNHPEKAAKTRSPLRGTLVRIMTPEERIADIEEFGKEIRKSKASALAFMKKAGFIDDDGNLAEPYRN